jgi:hypothetical protein
MENNVNTTFTTKELIALDLMKDKVQEIKKRPIGSLKIEKNYILDGDDSNELFNSIKIPTQKEKGEECFQK